LAKSGIYILYVGNKKLKSTMVGLETNAKYMAVMMFLKHEGEEIVRLVEVNQNHEELREVVEYHGYLDPIDLLNSLTEP
jgi:hypothetical protein